MPKVIDEPGPLGEADILKKHRVCLVTELNIESMWPCLKNLLPVHIVNNVESEAKPIDKIRKLLDLLYRCTQGNNYQYLNSFLTTLGGTQPELFNKLLGRLPTREESDFCIKVLSLELKAKLTGSDPDIELAHAKEETQSEFPNLANKLDQKYQFCLHGPQGNIEYISILSILDAERGTAQRALIYGRPEVGKSTALHYLARQWADDKWATGFRVLFLIEGRMLVHTETQMTTAELLLSHKDMHLVLSSWMKHAAGRILLLIDALDEIHEFGRRIQNTRRITDIDQRAHPLDLCINILRRDLIPECTILCTSRSFEGLKELQFDTSVELFRLREEDSPQSGLGSSFETSFSDDSSSTATLSGSDTFRSSGGFDVCSRTHDPGCLSISGDLGAFDSSIEPSTSGYSAGSSSDYGDSATCSGGITSSGGSSRSAGSGDQNSAGSGDQKSSGGSSGSRDTGIPDDSSRPREYGVSGSSHDPHGSRSPCESGCCGDSIRKVPLPESELVRAYLKACDKGVECINETQVMIIGPMESGKTSLLRCLLRGPFVEVQKTGADQSDDSIHIAKIKRNSYNCPEETSDAGLTSTIGQELDRDPHVASYTSQEVKFVFRDFTEQGHFHKTLTVHLSKRTIYIVVLDATKGLKDTIKTRKEGGNGIACIPVEAYLENWISLIHNCGKQKTYFDRTTNDNSNIQGPPMVFVCTHKDQLSDEEEKQFVEGLHNFLDNKHIDDVFYSKILRISTINPEEEVTELKDVLAFLAKYQIHNKPALWVKLKEQLQEREEKTLTWPQVMTIAQQTGIHGESDVNAALTFLHLVGELVWFDVPSLSNFIVTDPSWLFNKFRQVIEIIHVKVQSPMKSQQRYRLILLKEGLLHTVLVEDIWPDSYRKELLAMLDHFDLIKPATEEYGFDTCGTLPDQGEIYHVPARHPTTDEEDFVWDPSIPAVRFQSIHNTMQPGTFTRLITSLQNEDPHWGCLNIHSAHAKLISQKDPENRIFIIQRSTFIEIGAEQDTRDPQALRGALLAIADKLTKDVEEPKFDVKPKFDVYLRCKECTQEEGWKPICKLTDIAQLGSPLNKRTCRKGKHGCKINESDYRRWFASQDKQNQQLDAGDGVPVMLWDSTNPDQEGTVIGSDIADLLLDVTPRLKKTLVLDDMLSHLCKFKVLTDSEKSRLKSVHPVEDQVEELVDSYIMKGPQWKFHALLRACALTGQKDVIRNIFNKDPQDYLTDAG